MKRPLESYHEVAPFRSQATSPKPETQTHCVTWLHIPALLPAARPHLMLVLPGASTSTPTDISLSFRVSERLQRNSPACFNRFWITMPDMNCLQTWSRAYDDHIKASRRKRKSEHCQLPCELSLSNSHLSLQHSPALTSLPETSDKCISASLRAHIKEINKPSVDGSSELDFILFTGSVWAKLQQAQLVLQVESCSCGGPMRRAAVGMQQKEFKVETPQHSARTTRVLRVQEKYCPLITSSLPQGGHFTQWSCDQLEPITGKGTESICRSVPAAKVWVWH